MKNNEKAMTSVSGQSSEGIVKRLGELEVDNKKSKSEETPEYIIKGATSVPIVRER